jgi:hypothetical protein
LVRPVFFAIASSRFSILWGRRSASMPAMPDLL